jgi:hypothetical protein
MGALRTHTRRPSSTHCKKSFAPSESKKRIFRPWGCFVQSLPGNFSLHVHVIWANGRTVFLSTLQIIQWGNRRSEVWIWYRKCTQVTRSPLSYVVKWEQTLHNILSAYLLHIDRRKSISFWDVKPWMYICTHKGLPVLSLVPPRSIVLSLVVYPCINPTLHCLLTKPYEIQIHSEGIMQSITWYSVWYR